jgi:hypothetical protein
VAVLFFVLLLYLFSSAAGGDKYNWSPTFSEKGRQPFDLAIFYDLFTKSYKLNITRERVTEVLPNDASAEGAIYCFIGNAPKYSEEEAEHMMRFAENGGTIFISAEELPDSLMQFLFFRNDCGFDNQAQIGMWKSSSRGIAAQFTHPNLIAAQPYTLTLPQNVEAWQSANWSYFPLSNICENNTIPLVLLGTVSFFETEGTARGRTEANFVRFNTKRGYVYIHTNPRLFSNYYMQTEEGFEYANKVLGHFNSDKIYWDRVSTVYPRAKASATPPRPVPKNPMEYIYGQAQLRNAWYVLLGATLLFMVFRAKRRQRVIPLLEPNVNTSLAFVKTIGQLYFQQQNHRNIYNKLMQHFLAHLRQRYHIVAAEFTPAFVERVAYRTDISHEIVSKIFSRYENINQQLKNKYTELHVAALNDFYTLIQAFHKAEADNIFNENKRLVINQKGAKK